MNAVNLVLASASPRRAELLKLLNVPFVIDLPEVVETAGDHLAPREICLANAVAKAREVARRRTNDLVLAADTEVAVNARVLGKPRDRAEAAGFLEALSGRTHQVITAVCLWWLEGGIRQCFTETTHVTFHPLTADQIAQYLGTIDPHDKAGAYAIQDGGERIIESIHGSFSNVVGLPVGALRSAWMALPERARPRFGDLVPAPPVGDQRNN